MKNAITAELKTQGLQANLHTIKKTMQLFETKFSRHSVMMVGGTQSGKTVAWKTLQGSLIALFKRGEEGYQNVKVNNVFLWQCLNFYTCQSLYMSHQFWSPRTLESFMEII